MNYLTVENLSKSFGEKLLFENITFGIEKGQKVALIARNGTGKTTLLNIITGKETADEGKVILRKNIRIAYLPQNPEFNEGNTIIDAALSSDNETIFAIRQYESILNEINNKIHPEGHKEELHKKLHEAMHTMDVLNAWDYESRIREVLSRLKIDNFSQKVCELSGGQKKRLALARVLIDKSDLLILDEPTNHLDIEMIEWIEEFLSRQNLSIMLVTHDRYFLDNVCNEIMEMETGNIFHYKGGYAYYLEKKQERISMEKIEQERSANLFRQELEWMRRMPQARTTKSKARIDAFYDLKDKAARKYDHENIEFRISETRIGGKVLEMNNVYKSFGEFAAVSDFTYTFKKGERIGICGINGVGKTTFTNLITGKLKQDKGKISVGQTIVFGYFSQETLQLNENKRVLDLVKDVAESVRIGKTEFSASRFLYHFGFSHSVQYSYASSLSGGERRRLQLILVLMKNPNFLILDEPTNDLDIQTLNALEDFLADFKGCLIIISHDRYFLDTLTDHLFVFEGDGKVKDFPGNYTAYSIIKKKKEAARLKQIKATQATESKIAPKTKKPGITYKEKMELLQLEKEIHELESEKNHILNKLNDGEGTPDEMAQYASRFGEIECILNKKTTRWIYLEDANG